MHFALAGDRPDEAPTLQTFGEQAQAVPVCPQYLYHVTPTSAEDEKVAGVWFIFEDVLNP